MSGRKSNRGKGILAALFLLPLVFIIYFVVAYSSQSISLDNVTKITVATPGSPDRVFESQEDIDFFVNMLNGSMSINNAIRDVSNEKPVYIICDREDRSVEYKLYPSLNLSGCLLIAPEGDLYVLQTETAKTLLLRSEFDYLYSSLFTPALSVVSGDNRYEVLPIESEWSYLKSDGAVYSYTPEKYATGNELYTIYKGLDNTLTFSPNSDTMPYTLSDISFISENGSEYNIKDISELDLSVDTVITISFTAEWSGRSGAQAYGTAKYKFNVLYDIPAVIELPKTDFTIGDVIEINASHLNKDELVTLETLLKVPGIDFGMINDYKGVALLPVGLENPVGSYTLKLTAGVNSVNTTVNISDRESTAWKPIEVSSEEYWDMLSPDKISDYESAIAEAVKKRPETDYFVYGERGLRSPVGDKKAVFSYGQIVNLGVADASGDSGERTVKGVVYELNEGTSVRSAQAGEVVFSGALAPTGNTVIIYHGYGIYTYYYHLDSVDVQAGDVLTDGQIIGTAGQSGFTGGKTVLHYAVSIDGVFVDPDWFAK